MDRSSTDHRFHRTGIVGNTSAIVGGASAHNSSDVNAAFEANAPTTAAQAATMILDAVKAEQWRVLIGEDAKTIDREVRANPEEVYERRWYIDRIIKQGALGQGPKLKM